MLSLCASWSPVEVRRTIAATREEVFAVLADTRSHPDWLFGAQQMRAVAEGFPTLDTELEPSVASKNAPAIDNSTEVLAVNEPRYLSLRVRSGLVQGTINLLLLPSKGATEVRFRERPLGLAVFATPALRLALQLRNRVSLVRLDNVVCARQAAS